jgi:hypothetical protein
MPQKHGAYLPHLIDLGMPSIALQVDSLLNASAPEDMVASASTLFEAQPAQETAELLEVDTCIGSAQKNLVEQLPVLGHMAILLFASSPACAV